MRYTPLALLLLLACADPVTREQYAGCEQHCKERKGVRHVSNSALPSCDSASFTCGCEDGSIKVLVLEP